MDFLVMASSSLMVGFLGGLLGIGGGTFLVPILVFLLHFPLNEAMSISLICVFGTALSGLLHLPRLNADFVRSALFLEPFALLGAVVAVPFTYLIAGKWLLSSFAIFLIVVAWFAFWERRRRGEGSHSGGSISYDKKRGVVCALITGLSSGLFGIGGGALLVPLLSGVARMPLHFAVQTSLFLMMSTSAIAICIHLVEGSSLFGWGSLCFLCALPSGWLGIRARQWFNEWQLQWLFVLLASFVGFLTLARTIYGA